MGAPDLGPDYELAKRLSELEAKVRGLSTRDVLQNASIGAGGLTITNGGSLTVDGTATFNGSLTVPSGSLNTGGNLTVGGSITAGTTITAGGALTGTSLVLSGSITGATSVSASGNIAAGNNVNAGGDVNVTGYVFTPAGYAYDITYTRRTAWLGNDGRLGYASSSITGKELLDTIPEPDVLLILDRLRSHHYLRKPELAKRELAPGYHVATEWGGIAEEFHDLGLWQVVVYEWDVVWDLEDVLGEDGEPIVNDEGLHLKRRVPGSERRVKGSEPRPIGLHYELLGMLALVGLRQHREEHKQLRLEHDRLEAQLRAAGVI